MIFVRADIVAVMPAADAFGFCGQLGRNSKFRAVDSINSRGSVHSNLKDRNHDFLNAYITTDEEETKLIFKRLQPFEIFVLL